MRDDARAPALLIAIVLSLAAATAQAQDGRPNVVILLADDLGLGDLGCYGQTRIATPHLDALAAEGVRATHAYAAAPVCAPSRCALLTGMHTGHCAVDHNDEPNVPLGLSDPTLAEVLAREGYRTAIVGKWGLGGETDHGEPFATYSLPNAMGFEHALVVLDQERAQDHFPERVFVDGGWRVLPENADGARGLWDADVFADDALAWIDAGASDPRPLFLYFASTLPHRELDVPDAGHADTDWPEAERAYATMVERFDADVGRIVARLDALGGARSTIVIVASDNGPVSIDGHAAAFFDSAAGLRGEKRDLYEGGLRVPLIVRWRGQLAPRALETPVTLYDLFPTVAALVGAGAPAPLDGVVIAPWLRGERTDAAHARMFFSVSEASGGAEDITRFALYEGPLALIERADGAHELYDLVADPRQGHDLAAERADDVARLHAARLAESTGPVRRSIPVMEIRGETALLPSLDPRAFAPVLALVRTTDGIEARADVSPRLAVTAHGGGVAEGDAEAIALPAGDYLTLPSHPALSFGDASFTVRARVRLDHVVPGALSTREGRRYLALAKPTASPDEMLDWGVLVQAADLAIARNASATGHELAFVFADPEIGGHGTWTVVAPTLAITDSEWHVVTFRFDAEAGRAAITLDDRSETVDVEDLGHVRSDGPLVIGAHHDVHGTFDGFLDGALRDFQLSRGVVPDEALDVDVREPTYDFELDLGTIEPGADEVTRTLYVTNVGTAPSLAIDVAGTFETSDERVTVELTPTRTVTDRVPITIRVRPTRPGPFTATAFVSATIAHLGIGVRGPMGFTIHGDVLAPAPPSEGLPFGWLVAGLASATALAVLAMRLRRSAR